LQKIIGIIILAAILSGGCSVSRKNSKTSSSPESTVIDENSLESVIVNNLSNNDFHIQKADINVIQNNVSVRFTANIKFKKPDTLLITVRSKSGIEAGRALITKDTILINDRINKKLLIGSPAVIGPKYGIEPSLIFVVMGDIIVNDMDFKRSVNCIKGTYKDEFKINGRNVEYIVDCDKRKVTRAYFEGDVRSGNITFKFNDIVRQGNIKFPSEVEVNDDLNSISIILNIKKVESPWNGRIVFVPGYGYRVIKIR
jgi:hypothetical protein